MKKLLGLLLVMTMAWPVTASADVLKNVDLKGEVQVIGSDVRTNEAKMFNSGTNVRVLVGASFDLVEDVRANLLFQYGNMWGNAGTVNDRGGTSGSNLDSYWKDVNLVEANVVLSNLFCCLEATVGRQFYGDENSAVMYFGPTHYNAEGVNLANAVDAVKLAYSDDFKTFTLIAGKLVTDMAPAGTGLTTDSAAFYGADLKLNLTDTLTAQIYGYDFRNMVEYDDNGVTKEYENAGFYGAKVTFAPEAFTLSGEYARNFGGDRLVKEPKDAGYMAKFDAAINLDAFTPRAAFVYSANDFWSFGNYRPGIMFGDVLHGDVFGAYGDAGLRLFNVGIDYKVEKWTFALDGFSFQDRYAHHAATLEADLTAKYAHNEYVELFAGVGYAKYGTEDKADGSGKDNTKGQIGMLVKF